MTQDEATRVIYIMRHARYDLLSNDQSLSPRGTLQCAQQRRALGTELNAVDVALHTSEGRTVNTAAAMLGERFAEIDRQRYPTFSRSTDILGEAVRDLPPQSRAVLIVGHEPQIVQFLRNAGLNNGEPWASRINEIIQAGNEYPYAGLIKATHRGQWADFVPTEKSLFSVRFPAQSPILISGSSGQGAAAARQLLRRPHMPGAPDPEA